MQTIYPVLLCGGSGTRLWPLSRKSYPKQFVQLTGEESLFMASAKRFHGAVEGLHFAKPTVLTHCDFRFIVTEQLAEAGIDPGAVLIEPDGRNTAPAILAAALHLAQHDPSAVMLVAPSDHVVPDRNAFHDAVRHGLGAVAKGDLVTFGITPDHPETGYGYLELAEAGDGSGMPVPLAGFVEKPDANAAAKMLAEGRYLWNAGIFLAAVSDMIAAFEAHAPDLVAPVRAAVMQAQPDLGFLRLAPTAWDGARSVSVDYAVMEKAANLSVVPFSAHWSDLGGWDAVWREAGGGVITTGGAEAIDCSDTLLRAEDGAQAVVGIGLDNIMAVAMPDAVLVADMRRAQDVKKAVEVLKAKGAGQAEQAAKDHRPWGWFETLVAGSRFQVKRILVHPGEALSLQSHVHRSEHWIVVEGTARVTLEDEVRLVTENESIYIPVGHKHRLENPGKVPMVLIEVQTGAYVGEDDIVRYEDNYARG